MPLMNGKAGGMTERKHKYTKCWGDGSPRGFCRCGKEKENIIHDEQEKEFEGNVYV